MLAAVDPSLARPPTPLECKQMEERGEFQPGVNMAGRVVDKDNW